MYTGCHFIFLHAGHTGVFSWLSALSQGLQKHNKQLSAKQPLNCLATLENVHSILDLHSLKLNGLPIHITVLPRVMSLRYLESFYQCMDCTPQKPFTRSGFYSERFIFFYDNLICFLSFFNNLIPCNEIYLMVQAA